MVTHDDDQSDPLILYTEQSLAATLSNALLMTVGFQHDQRRPSFVKVFGQSGDAVGIVAYSEGVAETSVYKVLYKVYSPRQRAQQKPSSDAAGGRERHFPQVDSASTLQNCSAIRVLG